MVKVRQVAMRVSHRLVIVRMGVPNRGGKSRMDMRVMSVIVAMI